MVKAALITPLYLSVAWTLMVSYQLFTQTAVTAVLAQIDVYLPWAGAWLASRADTIVFIYAFAWVFVLSSVIPSAILGRERSVLVQFFVCLTLTLSAFVLLDVIKSYAGNPMERFFTYSVFLSNPLIAGFYLAIPYIFMIGLDLRVINRRKRDKMRIAMLTKGYLSKSYVEEQNSQEVE